MFLLGYTLVVLATAPADTVVMSMDEVVVTGSRASQPVSRIPAAISIVDRSRFEKTRTLSLRDALGQVPGVFVQSRSGGEDVRVTIRGFGARGNGERSNVGNMRGIQVLTDGIPVTEPDGRTSLDLVDVGAADRIEISRSNVSALYGNAAGGVVNVRTNLDFTSPWLGYQQRLGSWEYHREQGLAGFTLGSGTGAISLSNSTFGGWRGHSTSTAARAQVRFATPLDADTRLGILLDAVSDLNRFPGPLTRAQADSAPRQANPRFVSRDERRRNRVGRLALTLDRAFTTGRDLGLQVYVEPKVLQRSERNRFRDFDRYHVGGSATFALAEGTGGPITGTTRVGVDESLQDGAIRFYNLGPGGTRSDVLFANKREAANAFGAFLGQEVTWNEQWILGAAARFDRLDYISEDFLDPDLDARRHFGRVTPKGSIAWRGGTTTVYAALGGGVEAPAFNEIDPPPPFDTLTTLNPFLEPMRSITYELGVKGERSLGGAGRLRWDAAAFTIDVRNEIVPFNGGAYFFTAGRSRRNGFELGLDWIPASGLLVSTAATFMKSEYREYANDLGDFGGNDVPGLPDVVVSGRARWTAPMGFTAELSAEHVGAYFADDANTAETRAHTLFGASLGYTAPFSERRLFAFVAGENLTDEEHDASVFINGTGGEFFEPGLPRNVSAGFGLRW